MALKEKVRKEIFDRAYRKASQLKPGGENPLTPLENQVLLEYIETYERNKQAAFQEFWERVQKENPSIPYAHAKMLFKEAWRRRVMGDEE